MAVVTCEGCGAPLPPGARKWCSERCRKAQYDGVCEDCGARMSGTDPGRKLTPCCHSCANKRKGVARHIENRALIEGLWAEGKTSREIAAIVGWGGKSPKNQISTLRARGYDLPHRRTPEQLARMAVGAGERLAKARAVYRASRAA